MNFRTLTMAAVLAALATPLYSLAPRPPEELEKMALESKVYVAEGDEAMGENDFADANYRYLKAVKLDPTNKYAWQGLGNAQYYLGNRRKARQYYARALKLDRGDAKLRKMVFELSY